MPKPVYVVLLLAAAVSARAQDFRSANDLVQWTADAEPDAVAAGEAVRIGYAAQIRDGWKLYALDSPAGRPVSIRHEALPAGASLVGEPEQTEPEEGYDPNFQTDVRYFERTAEFWERLSTDGLAPGTYTLEPTVTFMVCDPVQCVPGRTTLPITFEVTGSAPGEHDGERSEEAAGGAPGAGPPVLEPTPAEPPVREEGPAFAEPPAAEVAPVEGAQAGGGVWAFVLLAIGAGLAALLTPCVFPMIPLTVSYFAKESDRQRGRAVRMALVYGLVIVVTFTALGVLAALWVGAAGAQTIAANPWINLFIGLVFVVFALSLLGMFELRLPNGLLNYFNRQSTQRGGLVGIAFMGLTITLVSFSCTAPFVGGLLAATVQGSWAMPILGMVVFSATFALPFVAFALFPNALSKLPRAGSWMTQVKVVLGFIELAAALKFLSNADLVWGLGLLSRPLAIALSVVIFFLAGLYLIDKLRLEGSHGQPGRVAVPALLAAVAFFGLSIYLVPGLFGASLGRLDAYLPPRQSTDVSLLPLLAQSGGGALGAEAFDWHDDIDAAFEQARAEAKPVFIDFTGYTCTNCRHMEATVFPRPPVAEQLERDYVLLRLYTDDPAREEELQTYQLRLTGTTALPTYAIVDPDTRRLVAHQSGVASVEAFARFLEEGRARFGQRIAAGAGPAWR